MITKVHKSVWISASVVAALVVLFNLQPLAIALATISWSPGVSDSTLMALEHTGQKELKELDQKLRVNVPKGHYLVVNSTVNEFYLYKGEQMVKKDICSTGSYVLLKKSEKEKWMFKTPKGEFRIRNKTKDPVWKKPDWAFVEEGLPVPSANHPSRFEYGVLGDYSLSLGDGYLIHGTLFQRFLGLPVTHGCIRLDDENLELVYKSLPMGSKVFIF
ncbi:L,D-transpeptidase [Roseivirga sp. UBA1976]|uniref:L,D-transpeptidase n=1 Tax=Roseivirga sp. UBA1976 TaxID=1947386 RepID=UPI00257C4388|nr:L,D-transpeptidase [Roseivirga sp. UBA1976]MEC7753562.1 L,D-transpeptidase [Bacteroidota bacterium]|tara:strand:+ start:2882 stop:3529 length:648 start_codon:yes stop_codon:yes gene_type:complete